MTTYLLTLALWVTAPAQLRVNNEAALTADQRAVLPLVELVQGAILQGDRSRFTNMFETSGRRLTSDQIREIDALVRRIENPTDILSCAIFDTACARAQMKTAGVPDSDRFVSVKEFLQKHRNELQVTFQDTVEGVVQVVVHPPFRPDSATVPPPPGTYDALTIGFLKVGSEWKMNVLFPEMYRLVLLR